MLQVQACGILNGCHLKEAYSSTSETCGCLLHAVYRSGGRPLPELQIEFNKIVFDLQSTTESDS